MIVSLVAWLLLSNAQVALSQTFETRLVMGTGVVCRAQPDRESPVVEAHELGELLTVRDTRQDRSGAEWYEVI